MISFYQSGNAGQKKFFMTIPPEKASDIIQQNKGNQEFEILDVRTLKEFNAGHLHNVRLIDFYSPDFKSNISKLDKTKTYLIYCHSGTRSSHTLSLMSTLGFSNVYNMEGGINKWYKKGLPIDH